MIYFVMRVIIYTAIATFVVSFVKPVNEFLLQKEFAKLKQAFIVGAVLFIAYTVYFSVKHDESLAFVGFDKPYSTGVWAALYALLIYIFAFEDFHLAGFVTSKGKEWRTVKDSDLLDLLFTISLQLDRNLGMSKAEQFVAILEMLQHYQNDLLVFSDESFLNDNEISYQGVYCIVKEERVNKFLIKIMKLIDLKC